MSEMIGLKFLFSTWAKKIWRRNGTRKARDWELLKLGDEYMEIHGTVLVLCVFDNFHNKRVFNMSIIKAFSYNYGSATINSGLDLSPFYSKHWFRNLTLSLML